ncbi:MAG: hypothetical protein RL198_903 [Actinomycetota bacterium]|jgi:hypothetical protein
MRWVVVAVAFLVVFGVFTTVFAAAANKSEVRVLPKWLWVLICALVPFFGGLLYLMVGRPLGKSPDSGRPGRAERGKRVVAPDDDPNFLKDLGKRLKSEGDKSQKDEGKATESEKDADTDDSGDAQPPSKG